MGKRKAASKGAATSDQQPQAQTAAQRSPLVHQQPQGPLRVGDGTERVLTFLVKLRTMVDDSTTDKLISWVQDGSMFIVHDPAEFAKNILPSFFKHNNFVSFVRQLNIYGFRKVNMLQEGSLRHNRDVRVFAHPLFTRDRPEDMSLITRKVSAPTSTDNKHPQLSEEMSHVLDDIRSIKQRQSQIQEKLYGIGLQNHELWENMVELRRRNERQQLAISRILTFLASVYNHSLDGSAGIGGMAVNGNPAGAGAGAGAGGSGMPGGVVGDFVGAGAAAGAGDSSGAGLLAGGPRSLLSASDVAAGVNGSFQAVPTTAAAAAAAAAAATTTAAHAAGAAAVSGVGGAGGAGTRPSKRARIEEIDDAAAAVAAAADGADLRLDLGLAHADAVAGGAMAGLLPDGALLVSPPPPPSVDVVTSLLGAVKDAAVESQDQSHSLDQLASNAKAVVDDLDSLQQGIDGIKSDLFASDYGLPLSPGTLGMAFGDDDELEEPPAAATAAAAAAT